MKIAPLSLDKNQPDMWLEALRQKMPEACPHVEFTSMPSADLVVVRIRGYKRFKFDEKAARSAEGKKLVILDFFEHECQPIPDQIFGSIPDSFWNTLESYANLEDYRSVNRWVGSQNVALYHKRELPKHSHYRHVQPIEYPCFTVDSEPEAAYRDHFDNRLLDLFYVWGPTHPSRTELYGALCSHFVAKTGKCPYLTFEEIVKEDPRWFLVYTPAFLRIPVQRLLQFQYSGKIGISLHGAGEKCMRDTEIPYNMVLAKMQSQAKHTYPWKDGENCIALPCRADDPTRLDCASSIAKLESWLNRKDLFDLYLSGLDTWKKYWWRNYLPMLAKQWESL